MRLSPKAAAFQKWMDINLHHQRFEKGLAIADSKRSESRSPSEPPYLFIDSL